MKAELEQIVQQGFCSIVNTASLAALTGFPTTTGYAASKHGVVDLTKTAAIECDQKVRANRWIATDMITARIAQSDDEFLARVPLREFGKPEGIDKVGAGCCRTARASSQESR